MNEMKTKLEIKEVYMDEKSLKSFWSLLAQFDFSNFSSRLNCNRSESETESELVSAEAMIGLDWIKIEWVRLHHIHKLLSLSLSAEAMIGLDWIKIEWVRLHHIHRRDTDKTLPPKWPF